MRLIYKSSIIICAFAFWFSISIHKHVPEDIPDRLSLILISDFLSFSEYLAEITDSFGFTSNRWWPYRNNLYNQTNRIRKKPDTLVTWNKFANVQSVIITPDEGSNKIRGTVVMYHGGGWVMGSIYSYLDLLVDVAETTGCVVMSPEYRLAPENSFPIPFEDSLKATLDYLAQSEAYKIDVNRLAIMGDSAGGNLAMAVTWELQSLYKSGKISYKPKMQVLVYPYLQVLNFKLPSHIRNKGFFVGTNLLQKCWLAYSGLKYRSDLPEKLAQNTHVKCSENKKLKKFRKSFLNSDFIDKKYLEGWDLNSNIAEEEMTTTTRECEGYDEIVDLMLDIRMSPLMMNDEQLSQLPTTHILVCGYDPLRDEGLILAKRLEEANVTTSLQYLSKSPHAAMSIGAIKGSGYHYEENLKMFKLIKNYLS